MTTSYIAEANIRVNKMLQTANEHGNGTFTLTNGGKGNLYVKAEITKLDTENGELKKIPLTRENFPLWDLAVSPSKTILHPGEIKDFSLKYLCQKDCDRTKDLVYQVTFLPVEPPKDSKGQSVGLRFGVAPVYILPAEESNVNYDFNYDDKSRTIKLTNNSNTFLKMEVDGCREESNNELAPTESACRAVFYSLAGRVRDIVLPKNMVEFGAKVTVANHDQSYEKSHNISGL